MALGVMAALIGCAVGTAPRDMAVAPGGSSWDAASLATLRLELETVIENEQATERDLEKQQRTLKMLKVYEAIPRAPEEETLKQSLTELSRQQGFELVDWSWREDASEMPSYPEVISPRSAFSFSDDHLVLRHAFRFCLRPRDLARLPFWYARAQKFPRLMAIDEIKVGGEKMEVRGSAFSFRAERYPLIQQEFLLFSTAEMVAAEEEKAAAAINSLLPRANPVMARVAFLNFLGARSSLAIKYRERARGADLSQALTAGQ